MSYRADITIIGAGLIGLGIAAQVVAEGREVYVLEKNETFGKETSSRQSGVIHSGHNQQQLVLRVHGIEGRDT